MRLALALLPVLARAAFAGEPGFNEFPIDLSLDVRPAADGGVMAQANHRDRMDAPGAKPSPSKVRVYIPPGKGPIRLVLFDLGDPWSADNTALQAVVKAERWVLAACLLRYKRGTELFDAAMGAIAEATKHPELKRAPVIPMGFSRNGSRAWTFLAENPDRTVALQLGGNPGICAGFTNNAEHVKLSEVTPAFTVVGSKDPFVDYNKGRARFWHIACYPQIRARNIPWGMMILWGGGHGWGDSWPLFVLFAQEMAAVRVAGPAAADGSAPLKPLRFADGWLVENGWDKEWPVAATVDQYPGDKAATVWLPSAGMVIPWRGFAVEKPRVTLAAQGTPAAPVLAAQPPEGATAVEFYDRSTRIGTAKAAPWTLAAPALAAGVRTVTAVAVLSEARAPSRPLTLVDGRAIDWKAGEAAQTAAMAPERIITLSEDLRAVLTRALAAKAGTGQAPAADRLAALRAALQEKAKDSRIEQRGAAEALLKGLP